MPATVAGMARSYSGRRLAVVAGMARSYSGRRLVGAGHACGKGPAHRSRSRSAVFSTLPAALSGSASRNSTLRGTL